MTSAYCRLGNSLGDFTRPIVTPGIPVDGMRLAGRVIPGVGMLPVQGAAVQSWHRRCETVFDVDYATYSGLSGGQRDLPGAAVWHARRTILLASLGFLCIVCGVRATVVGGLVS